MEDDEKIVDSDHNNNAKFYNSMFQQHMGRGKEGIYKGPGQWCNILSQSQNKHYFVN